MTLNNGSHGYGTDQERFWAGQFGSEYSDRNAGEAFIAANVALFSEVLRARGPIGSVLEFGANIGLNLHALKRLLPGAELAAVEINPTAVERLREIEKVHVFPGSMLDFEPEGTFDLAFAKGVLIHIAPERLPIAYQRLYDATNRYICVAEYYDPNPVEVPYRGHRERMYKRDFAGEMLDTYPDLVLVDYGFTYHRDPNFEHDDLTWFLLEKRADR